MATTLVGGSTMTMHLPSASTMQQQQQQQQPRMNDYVRGSSWRVPLEEKTQPRPLSAFLSRSALRRPPSAIRSLLPLEQEPGMLSLLAGKPNPATFPIDEISVRVRVQEDQTDVVVVAGADLRAALQYGPTAGLPALVDWLTQLTSNLHSRPRNSDTWQLSVGNGSQDLIVKAFEVILDAGDTALIQSPTYPGILPALSVGQVNTVAVESDEAGICTDELERMLMRWDVDEKTACLARPKLLYIVPTASNPTGTSTSLDRKRALLRLAGKYDFIIFEDDPYYHLSFEKATPSLFALDEQGDDQNQGRVMRFESLSKVMSAGLRIGFVAGPSELVEAINKLTATSSLQVSGVSQCIALAVLERLGHDGFLQHAARISNFYRQRRDHFETIARKILRAEPPVAEWASPNGGMFLWLRLLLPPTNDDSFSLISTQARRAGVLAVPGMAFLPSSNGKSTYVRVSFSLIEESDAEEAFVRLRRVILDQWQAPCIF